LVTRYQVNHVLPFYSVQTLIASDAMDVSNGSTEVIPYSNQIVDAEFYKSMEDKFMNVTLEQGDIFLFNRRLCHRGGKNLSEKRRNSAIMQCVWLFGIGQHDTDNINIVENVSKTDNYKNMTEMERERFHIRLKQPYPINTTNHN
jgi:ectoine hydroxylase-related dioxygenase (phytanoyl-CoA dioxygenase family)